MQHVSEHFINFCCASYGDTDSNKTLHKEIKACYSATNHKLSDLGRQLVAVRSSTQAAPLSTVQSDNNDPVQGGEHLESILLSANDLESENSPRSRF